ncbi:hypothetical protein BN1051_00243 [Arthrobacter saudimassiliensis]|uniref:DUF1211 domain-containing protein n=1 Tax=Arthrobacter saudimassiliensis TaxID=1461584 RepID=A0A078MHV4_9MICC|nr:hypothetical protein BN1051_00243 [Arthrobacter saudimassiliensis]
MDGSRNRIFREEFSSGDSLDRTASFSDAIFAVAMTLLAVGIDVPRVPAAELPGAVADQLPQFGAYALSFVVTGAYWLSHHRMIRVLSGYTPAFQRLNLLLLLFVALIGYATDMLVFHGDQFLGLAIYAGTVALIGGVDALMWLYCKRRHLFKPQYDERLLGTAWQHAAVAPLVFLLSVPIALASPTAAQLSWLAIPAVNIVLGLLGSRQLQT